MAQANTRPPGSQTGIGYPDCYAAPLCDCGGDEVAGVNMTREHPISKGLLKRFGGTLAVEGIHWSDAPAQCSPDSLCVRMLCSRHNTALSPLDTAIKRFDKALTGELGPGIHEFEGEDLERWAIKAMLGWCKQGLRLDGRKETFGQIPESWLRVVFGYCDMPEGCGFYYPSKPPADLDAYPFAMRADRYPAGDPEAGLFYGVTMRLRGFPFRTTATLKVEEDDRITYRPRVFRLGETGDTWIRLNWKASPYPTDKALVIKWP